MPSALSGRLSWQELKEGATRRWGSFFVQQSAGSTFTIRCGRMRALATARPISWLAVRDFHQFLICPSFNVLCSGTHGNTGSPFILEENMLLITLKELLERIR